MECNGGPCGWFTCAHEHVYMAICDRRCSQCDLGPPVCWPAAAVATALLAVALARVLCCNTACAASARALSPSACAAIGPSANASPCYRCIRSQSADACWSLSASGRNLALCRPGPDCRNPACLCHTGTFRKAWGQLHEPRLASPCGPIWNRPRFVDSAWHRVGHTWIPPHRPLRLLWRHMRHCCRFGGPY